MAPTTPYCDSTQVSYLLQSMFFGGAPSHSTTPNETIVISLIAFSDAAIDATFRSIGYKVPFIATSGETWPESQTSFLTFMSAVGAAAMAGGYILAPYPVRGASRGGGGESAYAVLFEKLRKDVENNTGFRAQYYLGTKAEKWLSEPYGPRIDYLEDYVDPTRYLMLNDFTDHYLDEFAQVKALNIDWDYVYSLRAASAA